MCTHVCVMPSSGRKWEECGSETGNGVTGVYCSTFTCRELSFVSEPRLSVLLLHGPAERALD